MKKLSIILAILLTTGCTQESNKSEGNPEYRAYIATRMAQSILEYQKESDEQIVEELCDGSGWITQGDGHRTECPGCAACESKGQEPEIEWSDESIQVNEILEEFKIPIQTEPEPDIIKTEVEVKTNREGPVRRLFSK
jgi:hypothetical protein